MNSKLPVADVAARLAGCRAAWLPAYFPAGRLRGGWFYLGNATGDAGNSLPIPLNGSRARLADFSGAWNGDDVALMAAAIGKPNDMAAGYREALRYLKLLGDEPSAMYLQRSQASNGGLFPADSREAARQIWRQAGPITAGLPLEYLRTARGLTSWHPERLLWHQTCRAEELGPGAIVAPVNCRLTGHVVGVGAFQPGRADGRSASGPGAEAGQLLKAVPG